MKILTHKTLKEAITLTKTTTAINHIQSAKTNLLNQSKLFCQTWCKKRGYKTIEFAHWIAIVEVNMLLTFRHQNCVEMHYLNEQLPLLPKNETVLNSLLDEEKTNQAKDNQLRIG